MRAQFVWMTVWIPALAAAVPADFRADVAKVPGTTAIEGSMAGTMNASAEQVFAVLCDYDHYDRFSKTIRAQAAITVQIREQLLLEAPDDPDDVLPFIVPGAVPVPCPGEADVLTYQDYPFPLSDAWLLSHYVAERDGEGYRIRYQRLAGSSKASSGRWAVQPIDDAHAKFEMHYRYDLGRNLPGFLIRWGAATEMPGMFSGIEKLARQRAVSR